MNDHASRALLIRGGEVIDGSGSPSRRADVRVRAGIITEVGNDLRVVDETELDATGALVTPGFIDGHTHFDPSLFWDPFCDPMPQHGVTTVLMGNCSLSLAPVRPAHRAQLGTTFGLIEEFPEAAFTEHVPWTWQSYGEYVATLKAGAYGVNVAALVGHSMVRLFVVGEAAWDRASTADERRKIVALVEDALQAGAAGLSTSFTDIGPDGRLVPSASTDDEELSALIGAVGRHAGHFELIPSGLVADDRTATFAEIERCARWCGASDVTMTWNGFFDQRSRPHAVEEFLTLARRLQADGLRAYPMLSPRPVDFVANWSGGLGFMYLPAWNRFVQADRSGKQAMINDPVWRERAAFEWDHTTTAVFPHHDLDSVIISEVTRPELSGYVGWSLGAWGRQHGGHPSNALADWVALDDLAPTLTYTIGNHDPARIATLINDPATILSGSDAGAHVQAHCTAGDTTLLLAHYVRDRGDLTVEAAVAELTARQADVFGFTDRGRIQVGRAADINVFALDELNWSPPEPRFDFPGATLRNRRPAGGFRATVVGGVPTQLSGEATGHLPGRWLAGKLPGARAELRR